MEPYSWTPGTRPLSARSNSSGTLATLLSTSAMLCKVFFHHLVFKEIWAEYWHSKGLNLAKLRKLCFRRSIPSEYVIGLLKACNPERLRFLRFPLQMSKVYTACTCLPSQ